MVLVVACAALLPQMMEWYGARLPAQYADVYVGAYSTPLTLILYLCCVPAMAALLCLDRLLRNIRREEVFTEGNVKLLRALSWLCFATAAIFAIAGRFYLLFIAAAVAGAFIGLILRVVKNVIQQAVLIKAENDYTI